MCDHSQSLISLLNSAHRVDTLFDVNSLWRSKDPLLIKTSN